MHRRINQVAVLGSGIMGSRIACHFANAGINVLLLDIIPNPSADELSKGLTIESKDFRNRIVNDSLKKAIQSSPSPLYSKSFSNRIRTGNLTDDISAIRDADWIIEVVIEKLEIKQQLIEQRVFYSFFLSF